MGTRVKDIDGGRGVQIEQRGDSVFIWGRGFSYEFDRGILVRALEREVGVIVDLGSLNIDSLLVCPCGEGEAESVSMA